MKQGKYLSIVQDGPKATLAFAPRHAGHPLLVHLLALLAFQVPSPQNICKNAIFVWIHVILQFYLMSRSFRLLSSHLDNDELLASARMTSPVIGLAIGILATTLLMTEIGLTFLLIVADILPPQVHSSFRSKKIH